VRDEAEDLVTLAVALDARVDLLDDPGVVAPEHDRVLVLEHAAQHPGRDPRVDRVDR